MQSFQTLTEQELITLVQNGHENAVTELVRRTKDKVYTSIYLLVRDKYIAEDFLQEVYIKALQKLRVQAYANDGKFGAWLVRIARNMCMDHFRASAKKTKVTLPNGRDIFDYLDLQEGTVQDSMMAKQSSNRVKQLLTLIPQDQRDVIVMRLFAKMSFKEIAEETNTTLNTCLGRMRYGLLNMRKIVEERQLVL